MKNNVKIIFTFALGVAVGSVTTWKLIKTKYEQIAQEEIDSVKEVYSKRKEKINSDNENSIDYQTVYSNVKPRFSVRQRWARMMLRSSSAAVSA